MLRSDTQVKLWSARMQLAGIIILAAAAYFPALSAGFVWDDESALLNNPLLRDAGGLRDIWITIGKIPDETHWWPLTYTVLWIGHQLWELKPAGFHAVNVLLHVGVSLQLWRLVRRLRLPGAWLAAAVFAVHPVHVEAVAWIIGVKDLLAAGFYLLAVECFIEFSDRRSRRWLFAATAFAIAAMLSKSIAITLPASLALLVWYRTGRVTPKELFSILPIGVVTLGIGLFDATISSAAPSVMAIASPPLADRVLHAGHAIWFYLGQLVWPDELSIIYPMWTLSARDVLAWVPVLAWGALSTALWMLRTRIGRGPLACWAFYAISLSPVLGFVRFPLLEMSPAADRYQYLASAGLLTGLAVAAGARLIRSPRTALLVGATGIASLLAVLGMLTWHQSALFKSQATVFGHAAKVAPDSWVVWSNLGSGLKADGKPEEALAAFQRATQLNPADPASWTNAGLLLMNSSRRAEAETSLSRALQIDPNCAPALTNLGVLLLRQKRLAEARPVWERRLQLQPNDVRALTNLAHVCGALGDPREQVALYRRALVVSPDQHDVLHNLALTLITTGVYPEAGEEALRSAQRAVECSPKNTLPRYLTTLAMTQAAIGRRDESRATAQRALRAAQEMGLPALEAQARQLLRAISETPIPPAAPN